MPTPAAPHDPPRPELRPAYARACAPRPASRWASMLWPALRTALCAAAAPATEAAMAAAPARLAMAAPAAAPAGLAQEEECATYSDKFDIPRGDAPKGRLNGGRRRPRKGVAPRAEALCLTRVASGFSCFRLKFDTS